MRGLASGNAWRCWIGPETLFYRDHGAYLSGAWGCEESQSTSPTACYTTGADHSRKIQRRRRHDPQDGARLNVVSLTAVLDRQHGPRQGRQPACRASQTVLTNPHRPMTAC